MVNMNNNIFAHNQSYFFNTALNRACLLLDFEVPSLSFFFKGFLGSILCRKDLTVSTFSRQGSLLTRFHVVKMVP